MRSDLKGGSYENHIGAVLADWFAPLPTGSWCARPVYDLPFRRRDPNGAHMATDWAGGRDLLHRPEIDFPFTIECKKSEVWELGGMFTAPKWPVWSWWAQAVDQAVVASNDRGATYPAILTFSKNRHPDYVIIDEGTYQWFSPHLVNPPHCRALSRSGPVVIALLSDLVQVPPAALRAAPRTPDPLGGCPVVPSSKPSVTKFQASLRKLRG